MKTQLTPTKKNEIRILKKELHKEQKHYRLMLSLLEKKNAYILTLEEVIRHKEVLNGK